MSEYLNLWSGTLTIGFWQNFLISYVQDYWSSRERPAAGGLQWNYRADNRCQSGTFQSERPAPAHLRGARQLLRETWFWLIIPVFADLDLSWRCARWPRGFLGEAVPRYLSELVANRPLKSFSILIIYKVQCCVWIKIILSSLCQSKCFAMITGLLSH